MRYNLVHPKYRTKAKVRTFTLLIKSQESVGPWSIIHLFYTAKYQSLLTLSKTSFAAYRPGGLTQQDPRRLCKHPWRPECHSAVGISWVQSHDREGASGVASAKAQQLPSSVWTWMGYRSVNYCRPLVQFLVLTGVLPYHRRRQGSVSPVLSQQHRVKISLFERLHWL